MTDNDETRAIVRLVERLALRFPHHPRELIETVVTAAHQSLAGAPIRAYVPVLVEHDAVEHLRSLPDPVPEPHDAPVLPAWGRE